MQEKTWENTGRLICMCLCRCSWLQSGSQQSCRFVDQSICVCLLKNVEWQNRELETESKLSNPLAISKMEMTCHGFVYANMPHISAKCFPLPFPKSQISHTLRSAEERRTLHLWHVRAELCTFPPAVVETNVKKSHLLTCWISTEFPNLLSWNCG